MAEDPAQADTVASDETVASEDDGVGDLFRRAKVVAGVPGFAPGKLVDRYKVVRRMGAGGMGVVFEARDTELDRRVALKVVTPRHLSIFEAQTRLKREAQAMAKLSSPYCVAIYDILMHSDQLVIAMELLDGGTLRDWMSESRTWQEVAERFVMIGRGLQAAHGAEIVHRDFKPENVLLGKPGEVRIADFGLAESATEPMTGFAGTPSYMSPEQLREQPADARSDQFSFAVAFYEALEGTRPFTGTDLPSISRAVLEDAPRPFARSRAPAWLHAVILRGLAREPDARWPSMTEMLAAIDRRLHRRRWPYIAGAGAVVAAGAAAIAVASRPPLLLVRVPTPKPPFPVWQPLHVDSPLRRAEPKVDAIAYDGAHLFYSVGDEYWVRTRGSVEAQHHRQPSDVEMYDIALSIDGARVFFATVDRATGTHFEVREVDVRTESVRVLERDTPGYAHQVPSPDGKQLLLVHAREARPHIAVIDLATRNRRVIVSDAIVNATWSPDSRHIAVSVQSTPPRVDVIDIADGRRTKLGETTKPSIDLAWPTLGMLVSMENMFDSSGLRIGRIYQWELDASGSLVRVEQVYASEPGMTLTTLTTVRDGVVWQAQRSDLHLYELELGTRAEPHQVPTGLARETWPAGWRRNGNLVLGALHDQNIGTFEVAPNGVAQQIAPDVMPHAVVDDEIWVDARRAGTRGLQRPDGTGVLPLGKQRLYVACARGSTPCVLGLASGAETALYRWRPGQTELGEPIGKLGVLDDYPSLSPDGTRLAGSRIGGIDVYELATRSTKRIAKSRAVYFNASYAPDGSLVAARRDGEDCEIIRISTSEAVEVVQRFPWCDLMPKIVRLSPDGKRVVFLAERLQQTMWRQELAPQPM